MHEDLLARRVDYPILARKTYLVNNSLGAMHRDTAQRLQAFADEWASEGVVAWHDWVPAVRRVGDLVGSLIGAPPGTTVMGRDVASLLTSLVSCVELAPPRTKVVCTAMDWPGSHYLWSEWAKRHGADLHVVPSADGIGVDGEQIAAAVDEHTAVVSLSHVLFKTSYVVDLAPVVAKAKAVGALLVVDGYQAAGVLPVDVVALGVDAYVGGSVKYLCGGPGNGWLYVRPELSETLRPWGIGWFGHASPFDFDFAEVAYADGIGRFTGGTPNVPAAYAAEPGYAAIADVGVQRVRDRSLSLTQPLLETALERGWTVRSPHDPARRGGHVTIDPGDAQHVHDELIRRGVVVDHRPGVGIRVGPHFFSTDDELARLVAEITDIRG